MLGETSASTSTRSRDDRVRLRPLTAADAPELARLADDWDIVRMTSRLPYPYRLEHAEAFLTHLASEAGAREATLAVEVDGALAGAAGLTLCEGGDEAEIGYWIGRSFWGRGVATAAAWMALAQGFAEPGLRRVGARVFHDNPASARVLDKLGFRRLGASTGPSLARGGEAATWLYALTRKGWEAVR